MTPQNWTHFIIERRYQFENKNAAFKMYDQQDRRVIVCNIDYVIFNLDLKNYYRLSLSHVGSRDFYYQRNAIWVCNIYKKPCFVI